MWSEAPVGRIVAALRKSPVYVDPAYDSAFPPARRAKLVKAIRQSPVPIFVALIPMPRGGAWESTDDLLTVIHDRLGREGAYIAVTQRTTDYITARHWGGTEEQQLSTRRAAYATDFERNPRDSGLADRVERCVELIATGKGSEAYDKAKASRNSPSPTASPAAPASQESGEGFPFMPVTVLGAAVLGAAGGVLWLRNRRLRAAASDRYLLPRKVFALARVADEAGLRAQAEREVIAFGELLGAVGNGTASPGLPDDGEAPPAEKLAALDAYLAAGKAWDSARTVADLVGVLVLVDIGRDLYAIAIAKAEDRKPPEQSPLCFFNPLHGDGTMRLTWRMIGTRESLKVRACAECAEAVRDKETPDILMDSRAGDEPAVPWFEAGTVWAETGYGHFTDDLVARVLGGEARSLFRWWFAVEHLERECVDLARSSGPANLSRAWLVVLGMRRQTGGMRRFSALVTVLAAIFLAFGLAQPASADPVGQIADGLKKEKLYVSTDVRDKFSGGAQSQALKTLNDADTDIRVVVAKPESLADRATAARTLDALWAAIGEKGTLAVISADNSKMYAVSKILDKGKINSITNGSQGADVQSTIANFADRVDKEEAAEDSSAKTTGFVLLGLFIFFAAGVVGLVTWSGKRRKARKAKEMAELKESVYEDVTRLGEDITRLDVNVMDHDLNEDTRVDYQRAMDSYDQAKSAVDTARQPEDMRNVTKALEEGRYSLACSKARLSGEPLPEKRAPCFFNPQHGPSSEDVAWAPVGGQIRSVPACAEDAARVRAGEDPDSRLVAVDGRRRPYWDAGPAYGPYAGGYYAGYGGMDMLSGIMIGTMLGSMMGGGWGGHSGGFDGGGGDMGGADFGGGDFGGGDFGGF